MNLNTLLNTWEYDNVAITRSCLNEGRDCKLAIPQCRNFRNDWGKDVKDEGLLFTDHNNAESMI